MKQNKIIIEILFYFIWLQIRPINNDILLETNNGIKNSLIDNYSLI